MLSSYHTWGFYFQLHFISWFWWAEVLRSESEYLHLSLFLSVFLSSAWWEQSRAQVADWDARCQVEHHPAAPTGVTPRVSPHECHPTSATPGFGQDSLERCRAKAATWDVPGFEISVPVRVFRGKREGKGIHPILIMTFEALPNYIVSLKTATQIFMSGTFYSHCNQWHK